MVKEKTIKCEVLKKFSMALGPNSKVAKTYNPGDVDIFTPEQTKKYSHKEHGLLKPLSKQAKDEPDKVAKGGRNKSK